MQWWANEPIIFCREGELESNRIRLLIAEKRAGCAVRVIGKREPIPEFLAELNPDAFYPFLACKDLVCYGHPLDELIHERYPAPPLLPHEPLMRAQTRLLTEQVTSWYRLGASQLRAKFDEELVPAFDSSKTFFTSREITVLDIAIAALLFDLPRIQYRFESGTAFTGYARMLLARPAFRVLERPHLTCAPIRAPTSRLEGAA